MPRLIGDASTLDRASLITTLSQAWTPAASCANIVLAIPTAPIDMARMWRLRAANAMASPLNWAGTRVRHKKFRPRVVRVIHVERLIVANYERARATKPTNDP